MGVYILRRILLMAPTMLGITLVVFFIMALAPGDIASMLINAQGEMRAGDRQAMVEYVRKRYGLNDPVPVQYLRWLNKISPVGVFNDDPDLDGGVGLTLGEDDEGFTQQLGLKWPDLGASFIHNRPVSTLIAEALPITVLLNLLSIPVIYILALVCGVYAARHRGKVFDKLSGLLMIGLWSVPIIWAGVLLQGYLANDKYLSWFPVSGLHDLRADEMHFLPRWTDSGFYPGWLLDSMWRLVLPVICLSYMNVAFVGKLARGAVLENLNADYVRTARAKGLSRKDVLWRHAFRNSLLPLITVAAFVVPGLLAGSIVVEYIFGINGMGKLMIESIELKDREVVMAVTLIAGFLSMAAFLVADLMYAVADPRVAYE